MVNKAFLCWKSRQPYSKMATKKLLMCLTRFFMLKTINKLTQRSFRSNHGAYMYIICVSHMVAILNMTTKKASADVKRSQFGFTTVETIWNNTKIIQIRHVGPMLWETKIFFWRPSLNMAAILNFLVANDCMSKVCLIRRVIAMFSACINIWKIISLIKQPWKNWISVKK